MLTKQKLSIIVSISGTILFLNACSSDKVTASKSVRDNKKSTVSSPELERLILAPPQLSLAQGIKKYASAEVRNMPPEKASQNLTMAAKRASDMGDSDNAELLLTEAIRLDANNGGAYYERGRARCNTVEGKDKAAIADLRKAISLGYRNSRTHIFLARLYDANNQPLKAIEELTIALKATPRDEVLLKSRAALYAASGQRERALEDYDLFVKINPNNTIGFFRRGQLLESMERFDEARAAYEKVVSLDESSRRVPLKPLTYKRLAAINSAKGKHAEAITNLTEASKLDATDDEPLRLRGLEYAKIKNYKKAVEDLTEAVELSPDSSTNFSSRAQVYAEMGRTELADKDRSEAKRLYKKPAELPVYDFKEPQSDVRQAH